MKAFRTIVALVFCSSAVYCATVSKRTVKNDLAVILSVCNLPAKQADPLLKNIAQPAATFKKPLTKVVTNCKNKMGAKFNTSAVKAALSEMNALGVKYKNLLVKVVSGISKEDKKKITTAANAFLIKPKTLVVSGVNDIFTGIQAKLTSLKSLKDNVTLALAKVYVSDISFAFPSVLNIMNSYVNLEKLAPAKIAKQLQNIVNEETTADTARRNEVTTILKKFGVNTGGGKGGVGAPGGLIPPPGFS